MPGFHSGICTSASTSRRPASPLSASVRWAKLIEGWPEVKDCAARARASSSELRLADARDTGCKAQAASTAARKVMGASNALAVIGWEIGVELACAKAKGDIASNSTASVATPAHPRRGKYGNVNKETRRSEKQLRRAFETQTGGGKVHLRLQMPATPGAVVGHLGRSISSNGERGNTSLTCVGAIEGCAAK